MIIDATGVESGLAVGNYIGIVKGVNYLTNEKKGTMSVSFTVSIDGTDRRTKLYNVEGKGVFFLLEALANMGCQVKGRFDLDELPLKGAKSEFAQSQREYNGTVYKELTPVKYIGRATDTEMVNIEGAPF